MLKKIALIGGGNIGGVLAQELFQRKLAGTVALVDVKGPDVAKGKCLDIAEGTPIIGSDVKFVAGKDYDVIAGADLVVNTAGLPRTVRPDGTYPSREELLVNHAFGLFKPYPICFRRLSALAGRFALLHARQPRRVGDGFHAGADRLVCRPPV